MFPHEPGISDLLNAARDAGIRAVEGTPATKQNLAVAASAARQTVLAQAEAGMWREWCVTSALDLRAITCEFVLNDRSLLTVGSAGAVRAPIGVKWNFLETPLRHLVTL